jgi:hypothetical protein
MEGKIRVRGKHGADAVRLAYVEGSKSSPVDELIFLASFHEGLVERLEREQHPELACGIYMEDQEKAVVLRLYFYLGVVPGVVVAVLVEPNLDSLILATEWWRGWWHGGGGGQQQWN